MAKIITKSNSDEIAGWIAEFLSSSPSTLLRLEGVCGSGKTTIGRKLSERGVGHISTLIGLPLSHQNPLHTLNA
jgi:tRNA A37 threonylcarbamoyladenosine biosynthesis protein TsaE